MVHHRSHSVENVSLVIAVIENISVVVVAVIKHGSAVVAVISWREAHSSTGRLVTGSGIGGSAQKTKLSITPSIFELEARNFACK